MHKELATPEVCREIDEIYDALTAKDAFGDLAALKKYCSQFPEALANPGQDDEYNFFWKVNGACSGCAALPEEATTTFTCMPL